MEKYSYLYHSAALYVLKHLPAYSALCRYPLRLLFTHTNGSIYQLSISGSFSSTEQGMRVECLLTNLFEWTYECKYWSVECVRVDVCVSLWRACILELGFVLPEVGWGLGWGLDPTSLPFVTFPRRFGHTSLCRQWPSPPLCLSVSLCLFWCWLTHMFSLQESNWK